MINGENDYTFYNLIYISRTEMREVYRENSCLLLGKPIIDSYVEQRCGIVGILELIWFLIGIFENKDGSVSLI